MAKAKKLPSGRWRVQAKKNCQTRSFTADSKKKAELMAAEWQASLADDFESMTVSQAYQKYFDIKKNILSPSTIRSYKKMHRTHFQSIMNIPIGRVTNERIQSAVNELAAIRSPKTVRDNYGLLTAVLNMYKPSFCPKVQLPQKNKKEIRIPSKEDVIRLLQVSKPTNYYIPILLAITCGMREGEICALTDSDIKENKISVNKSMVCDEYGKWQIKPPKSYAGYRMIEAPEFVMKELRSITGKIVIFNPHSLSVGFRRLLKQHGFEPFTFHSLRHFYVSQLFDIGLPEKYIIAQVGHSTSSITKTVYDHLSSGKQTEFQEKISGYFSTFS